MISRRFGASARASTLDRMCSGHTPHAKATSLVPTALTTFGLVFSGSGEIYFLELLAEATESRTLHVTVTLIVTGGLTIFVTPRRSIGLFQTRGRRHVLTNRTNRASSAEATKGMFFAYRARFCTHALHGV
jgi:hypothetical protein